MEEIILDAPDQYNKSEEDSSVKYAGFWIRVGASLIDGLILMVIYFIVLSFAEKLRGGAGLFILLINVVYHGIMESSGRQATVGKMACGIYVGKMQGERLGLGEALLRALTRIISFSVALLGVLMVFLNDEKQALHDKLLKTAVFYDK